MESNNCSDINLLTDCLPSVRDVVSGINFVIKSKQCGKFYHTKIQNYLPKIADHIIELWRKSTIPTITKKAVVQLIVKTRSKYLAALKKAARSLSSDTSDQFYVKLLDALFDIAACQCYQLLTSVENIHECICDCSPSRKIPHVAIPFYIDQRSSRLLLISSIGSNECQATEISSITSSESYSTNSNIHLDCNEPTTDENQNVLSLSLSSANTTSSTIFSDDTAGDPDFEFMSTELAAINSENVANIDLTDIAIICDAKQVSLRAAASIVSATLQAQSKVEQKGKSMPMPTPIISHALLNSALNRTRQKALLENNKTASGMLCFQFDGKICDTLVTHNDVAGRRNEIKKIEYIVVVKQPEDIFVASIPITTGSSADEVFIGIKNHFELNQISMKNVVAIGCDGAPVNTGVENGIVRRFEEFLGHPVQWIVCVLHLNELIFHRLFKFLDNSSCSPHGFASELGSKLSKCETLKPVNFMRIKLDIERLPENIDRWQLTSDQKYLLQLAKAIDAGKLGDKLSNQKPGKMNKARWVTTMSRILRVYVSEKNPSFVLRILALYTMKIYVPVLLAIKDKPSFTHGCRHLYLIVSLCQQYFNNKEYSAVYAEIKNTINNNAYFANSENILLSMLSDEDKIVRKLAFDLIIAARLLKRGGDDNETTNVRYFEKPRNINFNAKHYSHLIRLDMRTISEPPILQKYNFSVQNLQELSCSDHIIEFPEIPSHTQATERYVQITAQQVQRASKCESQQGAIHNTAAYRKAMPKFDTMKDFKLPSSSK